MRTGVLIALLILPTLCFAESTTASSTSKALKERAKRLYDQAQIHYRTGKLAQSATEFEQSYELYPAPEILFNLAQTHRLLKNYAKAIFLYKQFLATSDVGEATRTAIQDRIKQLEQLIEQQKKSESAPAKPVGKESSVPAASRGVSALLSSPHARRPFYKNATGMTLGIGGLVLVGIGGALLGLASNEGDKTIAATSASGFATHHANDLRYQQAGWPIFGIGAAAVAASVVVFVVEGRRR